MESDYPYAEYLARGRPSATRPSSRQRSFDEAVRLGLPSYAQDSARVTMGLTKRPSGDGGGGNDSAPTPPPDPGPQGSTAGVSSGTFRYSSVLPPLSPEAQRAFAERRRQATAAYERAEQDVARQRQQAEAAAVQGRRQIGQEQAQQSRAGMAELAGRGVARSPMFVNPFQRQVARQAQQRVGELEMGLGQTLENLRLALQDAEAARERELNRIEFDILAARSNVPQLLGMN